MGTNSELELINACGCGNNAHGCGCGCDGSCGCGDISASTPVEEQIVELEQAKREIDRRLTELRA